MAREAGEEFREYSPQGTASFCAGGEFTRPLPRAATTSPKFKTQTVAALYYCVEDFIFKQQLVCDFFFFLLFSSNLIVL